ncbi:hypothetical protein ABPG74_022370 [Tetrahymena malaccensis]
MEGDLFYESQKYILFIKMKFYHALLDRFKNINQSQQLQELDSSLKQFYTDYINDWYNLYLISQIDIKTIMQLNSILGEQLKEIDKHINEMLKRLSKRQLTQQISNNQNEQNILQNKESSNQITSSSNQLEQLLNQIYIQEKISNQQNEDLLDKEVNMVKQIVSEMNLKQLFGLQNVYVQPYGSLVSGFSQNDSDIDISINTDCYLNERAFLSLIYHFMITYLEKHKIKYQQLEFKKDARIPLITLVKQKENTDQINNIISIDICINNLLGCANSQMLKVISQAYPIVAQLGVIIKYWAKINGLISKKTLSSYAFILIMISFLQKTKLIDNYFQERVQKRQSDPKYFTSIKRTKDTLEEFETSLYFIKDPSVLQKSLQKYKEKNPHQKNLLDMNLASLFSKFIEFYTNTNEESRRYIDIVNQYILKKYNKEIFFYICDPLDTKHNPGERSKVENLEDNIYINGFRLAWQQLQDKQYSQMFKLKQ